MKTLPIQLGALFGLIAVLLGAFGAHGLKETLSAEQLRSFETGVRYQLAHAIVLLVLHVLPFRTDAPVRGFTWLITAGIILFSGSIYLLSTRELTGIDIRPVAWITPVGGFLLILFWALLAIYFFWQKS
jgi:uncharacterized membrane protein YgdD (TMEM256/DUF423 family)